jgi:pyrroline-5-carboxylate reductase
MRRHSSLSHLLLLVLILGLFPLAISLSRVKMHPHHPHHQHQEQQQRIGSYPSLASTSRDSSTEDLRPFHQDSSTAAAVRVGFIGCGTIASAIATGIATQSNVPVASIAVSRRSQTKSAALQQRLGSDMVSIHDDNQHVLDQSDIVFITVLPQQTSQVLQALSFDASKHILVSLVSTSQLDQLARDSKLPSDRVFKMICLPAVATLDGVCLITPRPHQQTEQIVEQQEDDDLPRDNQQNHHHHNTTLINLLESLGGMVAAETPEQMTAMMIPSGMMGTLYGILKNNRDFVLAKANNNDSDSRSDSHTPRLGSREATKLVAKYYHGMLGDVIQRLEQDEMDHPHEASSTLLEELIAEQTPGGLNEQALGQFETLGGMNMYDQIQESLWKRLSGQSDNK